MASPSTTHSRTLCEIDGHENNDGRIQLWIRHVDGEADTIAGSLGFRRYRDLCSCAVPCPITTAVSSPGHLL